MTMTRPLPLAICCGDPCEVGAELIPRVLKGERTHDPCEVGAELIPLKIRLKP